MSGCFHFRFRVAAFFALAVACSLPSWSQEPHGSHAPVAETLAKLELLWPMLWTQAESLHGSSTSSSESWSQLKSLQTENERQLTELKNSSEMLAEKLSLAEDELLNLKALSRRQSDSLTQASDEIERLKASLASSENSLRQAKISLDSYRRRSTMDKIIIGVAALAAGVLVGVVFL